MRPTSSLRSPSPVALLPAHELRRPAGVLRYTDVGAGPEVVCVHGNPTWAYHYRNLVATLSPDHRVVVPDHLGMGRSDIPEAARYGYDLAARVDDLTALLDELEIGVEVPATLIVHDWGGAIALAWATRHPERVGRLVLCNTAAFPRLDGEPLPWLLRPARMPVLGPLLVQGVNAFVRGTLRLGVRRQQLSPEIRRGYLAPYRSWRDRRAVLAFVRDIPDRPTGATHSLLTETAAKLHVLADRPTLLLWGLRDPVLTPRYLAEWRRRLPHAEMHVIADAGHLVLEDAPETVPLIVAFLARTRGMLTG